MTSVAPAVLGFAVALGIGLLIGIDRERRKGSGPRRAAAGVRTFAVASLVGAASAYTGGPVLLSVAVAGTFALAIATYVRSTGDDPGITTELALVVTVALGGLAMRDAALAGGLGTVVAIVLSARSALHKFVRTSLTDAEIRSGLILSAASLIVLPILPDQTIGPFDAVNPHKIWIVVILMMTIGAAGHIAVRAVGMNLGLPLVGAVSGFVSSAATIAAMGSRVAAKPELLGPASAGAVLSSVATVVQLAILLAVTSVETLRAVAVPLGVAGLAAVSYAVVLMASEDMTTPPQKSGAEPGEAFDLATTLWLAATFAGIVLFCAALEAWLGTPGVRIGVAIAGFTDTHAPAFSVAQLVASGAMPATGAGLPILAAMTTNSITKAVVAYTSGGNAFARRVVPGLALIIGSAWLGAAFS